MFRFKIMKAELFRLQEDEDLHFSHVGPGHERAYFNLLPLAGYAGKHTSVHPYFEGPFKIYLMSGGEASTPYKTIPAAKRAVRVIIERWIESAEGAAITWIPCDTGVHWEVKINRIQIANYYFCPEPAGHWHKGFRVWFGGTYYVTPFESPDQAREAIAETWKDWLTVAKLKLLKAGGL